MHAEVAFLLGGLPEEEQALFAAARQQGANGLVGECGYPSWMCP